MRKAYLAAAALPALIGLLRLACHGFPLPRFHDEFSYLLAAETFTLGRLTNPPFAEWIPFETFHVNQQPFYVSIYPPGQGLLLAAGQALTGHPWFGVLASVIALGMLSLWALEAWLPRRWALFGALATGGLAACSYWLFSYWGGALAACGGALILGASRRRSALLFALGAIILMNTRPYEGAVLVLAASISARRTARSALPIILAGLAGLGFYNWRLTGHPLTTPYMQNFRDYHIWPLLRYGTAHPEVTHRHDVMTRLYRDEYSPANSPIRGPWFLLPALALPWARRRPLWLMVLATTTASLLATWVRPHYLATVLLPGIALALQSLRRFQASRYAVSSRKMLTAGCMLSVAAAAIFLRSYPPQAWPKQRAAIEQQLTAQGGRHLVLVRYAPNHIVHDEWVYNHADHQSAPVLWARHIDDHWTARLAKAYPDRKLWIVDADSAPQKPHPAYPQ